MHPTLTNTMKHTCKVFVATALCILCFVRWIYWLKKSIPGCTTPLKQPSQLNIEYGLICVSRTLVVRAGTYFLWHRGIFFLVRSNFFYLLFFLNVQHACRALWYSQRYMVVVVAFQLFDMHSDLLLLSIFLFLFCFCIKTQTVWSMLSFNWGFPKVGVLHCFTTIKNSNCWGFPTGMETCC